MRSLSCLYPSNHSGFIRKVLLSKSISSDVSITANVDKEVIRKDGPLLTGKTNEGIQHLTKRYLSKQ